MSWLFWPPFLIIIFYLFSLLLSLPQHSFSPIALFLTEFLSLSLYPSLSPSLSLCLFSRLYLSLSLFPVSLICSPPLPTCTSFYECCQSFEGQRQMSHHMTSTCFDCAMCEWHCNQHRKKQKAWLGKLIAATFRFCCELLLDSVGFCNIPQTV